MVFLFGCVIIFFVVLLSDSRGLSKLEIQMSYILGGIGLIVLIFYFLFSIFSSH